MYDKFNRIIIRTTKLTTEFSFKNPLRRTRARDNLWVSTTICILILAGIFICLNCCLYQNRINISYITIDRLKMLEKCMENCNFYFMDFYCWKSSIVLYSPSLVRTDSLNRRALYSIQPPTSQCNFEPDISLQEMSYLYI